MMFKKLLLLLLLIQCIACGDQSDGSGHNPMGENPPAIAPTPPGSPSTENTTTYYFKRNSASSTQKSGQVMRQVLIIGIKHHIGTLTDRIDNGEIALSPGDIQRELSFFYDYESTSGEGVAHPVLADEDDATTPSEQLTYNELSTKNLKGKIAGNDITGQHKDWETDFVGWTLHNAPVSPEQLVLHWFEQIDTMAIQRMNGILPLAPDGTPLTVVYVTPNGQDLAELLQKFLMGAVSFSQAADDYLDDDIDGKGLKSDNINEKEGHNYTALEHGWDEAFGYFGAALDYNLYTDDEIAGKGGRDNWKLGHHDSDGNGTIDLTTEMNFGHSVNAAKRDRGQSGTDLTADAFSAFRDGRQLITEAFGRPFTHDEFTRLQTKRNKAVLAWEKAIAATVIHYIKDVLEDMSHPEAEYDFHKHAKHWSELKGFALSFQFNPRSPLSSEDFALLHNSIGQSPVLPAQDGFEDYKTALLDSLNLLKAVYRFSDDNIATW